MLELIGIWFVHAQTNEKVVKMTISRNCII